MENVINQISVFNPSLALGFKLQLLPGTEDFLNLCYHEIHSWTYVAPTSATYEELRVHTLHRCWHWIVDGWQSC